MKPAPFNRTVTFATLLAMLLCTAMSVPGCGGGEADSDDDDQGGDRTVRYTVENRTGTDIKDVAISGTSKALGYGSIDSDDSETLTDTYLDVPKQVEVTWKDGRGERHYVKVDLWRVTGQDYEGGIWLTIDRRQEVKAKKY